MVVDGRAYYFTAMNTDFGKPLPLISSTSYEKTKWEILMSSEEKESWFLCITDLNVSCVEDALVKMTDEEINAWCKKCDIDRKFHDEEMEKYRERERRFREIMVGLDEEVKKTRKEVTE